MKKVISVVLLSLMGAWGAVQAEDDTGGTLIGSYAVKQNLAGNDVDEMWSAAWKCYRDTHHVIMGADFNHRQIPFEEVKKVMDLDDRLSDLVETGYSYKEALDINIGQFHAKCLNDAHKKITVK